jgi:glucose-1-phosphate cytidylyltransferase
MRLVKDKQLMQFNHDGFWQPMDTFREYVLLNSLYEKNNAPWKKW